MEITEAKIKLMPSRSDRLQAFCTVTIDNDFVIRDIKIIEGTKGAFVAMPSRKLTDKCSKCGGKNHLRARYCNDCGVHLDENRATKDKRGRAKLHADIAHPINSACRERIQKKILEAFEHERALASQPGYVPTSLYEDEELEDLEELAPLDDDRSKKSDDLLDTMPDDRSRKDDFLDTTPAEEEDEKKKGEDDFASGIL